MKVNIKFSTTCLAIVVVCCSAGTSKNHNAEKEINAKFQKGMSFLDQGKNDSALFEFDAIIKLDPKFANFRFLKGVSLERLKRYEDAVVAYDEFLKLKPGNSSALNNKASCQFYSGKLAEALQSVNAALKTEKHPDFLMNKAGMLLATSEFNQSLLCYNQAKGKGANIEAGYLELIKGIKRQFLDESLPPANWKPAYDSYTSVLKISEESDIPEAIDSQVKFEFSGSKEHPQKFLMPTITVWQGGIIHDKRYGILLVPGTNISLAKIANGVVMINAGRISEDWKFVPISKEMKN